MAQELFSENLTLYNQQITNRDLLASIEQLKDYLVEDDLVIREWSEDKIAIPISIIVPLPPLGNADNLDIRLEEPVLLVIHTKDYPYTAPMVYPDRMDFPKDRLGHLYVAVKGKPPGFCFIRGTTDEWYADKQIKDLVIRISNWLRDAATGELIEDGDQFESLRLEGYVGGLQYNYDIFNQLVQQKKSLIPDSNFAKLLFERMPADEALSWKYVKEVTAENTEEVFEEIVAEIGKDDDAKAKKFLYYGYLVWSDNDKTYCTYNVNLPWDWESFVHFCADYGIDLTALIRELLLSKDLRPYYSIPIVAAIKRTKKLIGFSGNIEFINFHIRLPTDNFVEDNIIPDTKVVFKQHRQTLTIEKAMEISASVDSFKTVSLIAGCGALGSKIVLHLAKSGFTNFILADNDKLMPHNFVRHALSAKDVNHNKAVALKDEIDAIYDDLPLSKSPLAFSVNAVTFLSLLSGEPLYDWVFDFTASPVFLNKLATVGIHPSTQVCKSYISDFGDLGLLLLEGANRNPRIDDLQVLLYAQALFTAYLTEWLGREADAQQQSSSITVGVGCNSETTLLSDEKVSIHAAPFAAIIKQESIKRQNEKGKIYTNQIVETPFFHNEIRLIELLPLTIFNAINDPSWQIRVADGIIENLQHQLHESAPYETGGVFIGCANYKTRTIHAVGLIDAPPDSKTNEVCFFRGVEGLPESIDEINCKTGGQLGYIGEWHTHPKGPNCLSSVDIATARRFKKIYSIQPTPLPVFIMVLTPEKILPFVY